MKTTIHLSPYSYVVDSEAEIKIGDYTLNIKTGVYVKAECEKSMKLIKWDKNPKITETDNPDLIVDGITAMPETLLTAKNWESTLSDEDMYNLRAKYGYERWEDYQVIDMYQRENPESKEPTQQEYTVEQAKEWWCALDMRERLQVRSRHGFSNDNDTCILYYYREEMASQIKATTPEKEDRPFICLDCKEITNEQPEICKVCGHHSFDRTHISNRKPNLQEQGSDVNDTTVANIPCDTPCPEHLNCENCKKFNSQEQGEAETVEQAAELWFDSQDSYTKHDVFKAGYKFGIASKERLFTMEERISSFVDEFQKEASKSGDIEVHAASAKLRLQIAREFHIANLK